MDHAEEQEMEHEALTAILDSSYTPSPTPYPQNVWVINLIPNPGEPDSSNFVGVTLTCSMPADYPEPGVPVVEISIDKGLSVDHLPILKGIVDETIEQNLGMPLIFTICEAVRDWLSENNKKGLADDSSYAKMIRKAQDLAKDKVLEQAAFERGEAKEGITATEEHEKEVARKRAEGTPCTAENFKIWKTAFDAELAAKKEAEGNKVLKFGEVSDDMYEVVDTDNVYNLDGTRRLTGFEMFASGGNAAGGGLAAISLTEDEIAEQAAKMCLEEGLDSAVYEEDGEDLDDLDYGSEEEEEDDDDDDEEYVGESDEEEEDADI
jgi:hypothetical protein